MARSGKVDRIRVHLRRKERLFHLKITAMVVFGVPLSFLSPALFATIIWAVLFSASALFGERSLHVPWLWPFLPLTIILVPILFRTEILAGGEDYIDATSDEPIQSPASLVSASSMSYSTPNPLLSFGGTVRTFRAGPRLTVRAFRQAAIVRSLQADRDRAAAVLHRLCGQDKGLDTPQLLKRNERLSDLQPVLAYLSFHQWIGVGKKWRHVWLYTSARETLKH